MQLKIAVFKGILAVMLLATCCIEPLAASENGELTSPTQAGKDGSKLTNGKEGSSKDLSWRPRIPQDALDTYSLGPNVPADLKVGTNI